VRNWWSQYWRFNQNHRTDDGIIFPVLKKSKENPIAFSGESSLDHQDGQSLRHQRFEKLNPPVILRCWRNFLKDIWLEAFTGQPLACSRTPNGGLESSGISLEGAPIPESLSYTAILVNRSRHVFPTGIRARRGLKGALLV
jgi:hypothetical protein